MKRMKTSAAILTTAAALAATLTLTACTHTEETMSMSKAYPGWDFSQSTPVKKADSTMSGRFKVDADGKLINPEAKKTYEAPTPSDLAQAPDKNGAEAFARYFIEVVEYTWRTGNSELLRSISHPDCTWCLHIADTTDARTKAGGWIEGARVAIRRTEEPTPIPDYPGYWNIFMDTSQDPYVRYDGNTIHEIPLSRVHFQLQVVHDGEAWKAYEAKGEVAQ